MGRAKPQKSPFLRLDAQSITFVAALTMLVVASFRRLIFREHLYFLSESAQWASVPLSSLCSLA
jgi:hypothetical protein